MTEIYINGEEFKNIETVKIFYKLSNPPSINIKSKDIFKYQPPVIESLSVEIITEKYSLLLEEEDTRYNMKEKEK